MQNVKMKIVGYEEASGSLLVCFASDTTVSSNPEDYQAVAFQPAEMWPDIQDIEQIKLQIAKAGLRIVTQTLVREELAATPARVLQLQGLVNAEFEYSVSALADTVPEITPMLVL